MTKTIPLDEAFDKEIRDFVTDELSDNIGRGFYGSDLASELTMGENYDGCWIPWQIEARKYIAKHWDVASETYDYFKNELDMPINPFESPAKYTFFMLDFGVRNILNESPTLDRLWNEEFELTSELAQRIVSDIEDKTACPAW